MIVITGGFGFIGNEVVRQLKKVYGSKNIYIVDNMSRIANDISDLDQIKYNKTDIRDFNAINKIIMTLRPNVIIHLAALHYIPECNSKPVETLQTNVDSTLNLILSALENDVEHLIFASSGAVYADCSDKINEDYECKPVDIYGLSKLFAEQLIKQYLYYSDVKVSVCRFFNNYGPRETNHHILPEVISQLKSSSDFLSLGNINSIRDYVFVEDTAKAIITILENQVDKYKIMNIGSGVGFSVEELIKKISHILKRDIDVRLDKNRIRKVDKKVQVADISLILNNGFNPTNIDVGLTKLLKYENLI